MNDVRSYIYIYYISPRKPPIYLPDVFIRKEKHYIFISVSILNTRTYTSIISFSINWPFFNDPFLFHWLVMFVTWDN